MLCTFAHTTSWHQTRVRVWWKCFFIVRPIGTYLWENPQSPCIYVRNLGLRGCWSFWRVRESKLLYNMLYQLVNIATITIGIWIDS